MKKRTTHKSLIMILAIAFCLMSAGCNSTEPAPSAQASVPAIATDSPQAANNTHYPVTVTTYNYACEPIEITYEEAPEKIVTLNQQTTEVILELGLGDKLVGTAYMDNTIHPSLSAEYAKAPILSDKYPSKEAVIGSGADFLFGWRSAFDEKALGDVTDWHALGINTMIPRNANDTVPPASVENFIKDVRDLGLIFNIEDITEPLIADLERRLADVASTLDAVDDRTSVLFATPREQGDYWANGNDNILGDIINRAGGINLAESTDLISNENLINYDPDVLFVVRSSVNKEIYPTDEELLNVIRNNPALSNMRAVKDNKLFAAELADFNAGGFCRTVPAIETYAKAMHPEKYGLSNNDTKSHYPVTITNYNYACEPIEITYEKAPEKIVSCNQQTTEIMLELGLVDKIVGTAYMDGFIHPSLANDYAKCPVLSDRYPSKEAILGTGSDFIIGWRSAFAEKSLGDVTDWHSFGISTFIPRNANNTVPPPSIENFLQDIRDLGAIFDIEDVTDKYVADFEKRLAEVEARIQKPEKQLRVLFITPPSPGYDSWFIHGDERLVGDMIKRAGGINIPEVSADASSEDLISLDPDMIFVVKEKNGATTDEEVFKLMSEAIELSDMRAIKEGKIVPVVLEEFTVGSGRTIPSIEAYAKAMYPEMFS